METSLTTILIAGLVPMLLFGLTDVVAKRAIDKMGSIKANVYFLIVNAVAAIPLILLDPRLPELNLKTILLCAAFGITDTIVFLILFRAYQTGRVSVVNPITASYSVIAVIISFLFLGETLTLPKLLVIGLVILGVIFTAVDFTDLRDGWQRGDLSRGVPLALLFALILGIYVPLWSIFISTPGWPVYAVITRFITAGAMLLVGFYSYRRRTFEDISLNRWAVGLMLIAGLLQGIGANFYNWGLSIAPDISIIVALGSAYPLSLAVFSYLLLKERLVLNQYIGIGFIVLGVVCLAIL